MFGYSDNGTLLNLLYEGEIECSHSISELDHSIANRMCNVNDEQGYDHL